MPLPQILIVEDDKSLAWKFSRVLGGLGKCTIVESTSDVFYYLNFNPQVILLDICLIGDPIYKPEEAGIRILEKIRQLPDPDRNIPVIVITGCSDSEIENQCRQLGVENYFIKSHVSNEDLRNAVQRALELHENEKPTVNLYSENPTVILFLAANPLDTRRIEIDREFREIELTLRGVEFKDRFDIRWFGAVRSSDLQGYLHRYKPDIVHFSGHGNPSGNIILEGKSGGGQPVPAEALSNLFALLRGKIRCVVLNACYTESQAQAISRHVDCVIGMSNAIGDEAAISFATSFYQALGSGDNIKAAFELGCNQIDLDSLGEQDTPKLIALHEDPASISFVRGVD